MKPTRHVSTPFGVFVAFDQDLITDQLERFGAHAGGELAMILDLLRPGDHVIDVGAHIGTFALPMARAVGAGGIVVCFEPFAESFRLLELNVELNGLSGVVVARSMAVGTGSAGWTPVVPDEANTGATYLAATGGPEAMESIAIDEWLERNSSISPIDLIKIDTEGMELLVLTGAIDTIRRDRPVIYAEVAPDHLERFGVTADEVETLLRAEDYELYRNVGRRQGRRGEYEIAELDDLEGDLLFDLLAVHPSRQERIAALLESV